jgi:hypothetical protein
MPVSSHDRGRIRNGSLNDMRRSGSCQRYGGCLPCIGLFKDWQPVSFRENIFL